MMLEKKMIVGSTLKAKKCSAKLSPKTKRAPASLKSRNAVTLSLSQMKNALPGGVRRMITAKVSWSRVPMMTARQWMIRRLFDSDQAISSNTSMPRRETSRTVPPCR